MAGTVDTSSTTSDGFDEKRETRALNVVEAERATAAGNPNVSQHEDPFGDESNNEIKYRTMHWWQAGIIMIAETISLGILSLPSVLAAIGLVP